MTGTPRIAAASKAGSVLIWMGAAVVVVALVAALLVLPYRMYEAAPAWGPADLIAVAAAVVAGVILVLSVWRLALRSPRVALVVATGAFLVVRAFVALALDGTLDTDWLAHHRLAIGWTEGAPPIANRPMGYPILLGETYRIAGTDPASGEILDLVLGGITALLLAAWVGVLAGPAAAAVAVALLAVAPSQALYILLLGGETAYTTALLAVTLLVTLLLVGMLRERSTRSLVVLAVACGLVLGLSTYLRPTSLMIAPFIVLLPVLLIRSRRAMGLAIVLALAVLLSIGPAVILNQAFLDRWSPTTSLYAGWQLYAGTNVDSGGRRMRQDVERVDASVPGYAAGRLPREYARGIFDPETLRASARRDEVAMQLAIERIREEWPRLPLIVPFKLAYGWGPGDSPVEWVTDLGSIVQGVSLAAQVWWIVVLGAAAFCYLRPRCSGALARLVVAASIVPVAIGLLVLEVQPRYHEYVVPQLVGLAAMAAMGRAERARGSAGPEGAAVVQPDPLEPAAPDEPSG